MRKNAPPHKIRKALKGDYLFFQGSQRPDLIKLLYGFVLLYKLLPDGRRQIIYIAKPGDYIGFSRGHLIKHSALATTSVHFQTFNPFRASLKISEINASLIDQLIALQQHCIVLANFDSLNKIIDFLFKFINLFSNEVCPTREINLFMTREQIADYVGITIYTLSRTLSTLQSLDLIKIKPKRSLIVVNNIHDLRHKLIEKGKQDESAT